MGSMTLIAVFVAVLVAAGVGAAFLISYHSSGRDTAPTSTYTTATSTTTSQTTSTASPPDISGTWRGGFTASHWKGSSKGSWTWIIRRTGPNTYEGVLKTEDVYPTGGYIEISVKVNGNRITVGTVGSAGIPAATFTGTLSSDGRHAEGSWSFTNGADGGKWSGDRVSGSTSIPSTTSTSTTTTSTSPATTTSTGGQTTSSSGSQAPCSSQAPENYREAFNQLYSAATSVLGGMSCKSSQTIQSQGMLVFVAQLSLKNYESSASPQYAAKLLEALTSSGWSIITTQQSSTGFKIASQKAFTVDGRNITLAGEISVTAISGGAEVSIAVVSMSPQG